MGNVFGTFDNHWCGHSLVAKTFPKHSYNFKYNIFSVLREGTWNVMCYVVIHLRFYLGYFPFCFPLVVLKLGEFQNFKAFRLVNTHACKYRNDNLLHLLFAKVEPYFSLTLVSFRSRNYLHLSISSKKIREESEWLDWLWGETQILELEMIRLVIQLLISNDKCFGVEDVPIFDTYYAWTFF